MKTRSAFPCQQQGVAVVTALLLTTLAITIVTGLFWQQQVQVRSIENQRMQLQKEWVLRGALDWARLILREDAKHSSVDTLDEPWAVPLMDTRLDQFVENESVAEEAANAALSGSISDAQARYNLTNLCPDGNINHAEVAVFARLLSNVNLDPKLADATAEAMAAMHASRLSLITNGMLPVQPTAEPSAENALALAQNTLALSQNAIAGSAVQQAGLFSHLDDLLAVPGFTPEMIEALKELVIFLPRATPVNVNTASAEVLVARIDGLSLPAANALVQTRSNAYFRDLADFKNRMPVKSYSSPNSEVSVTTSYFLVDGKVRMGHAELDAQVLVERMGPTTRQIWIRKY